MKNNFATQFKELRKRENISQEEIAEMLNVTSQAVSKWENDKSFPDVDMLIQIAKLFKVSLDVLITGEGFSKNVRGLPDDEEIRVVLCQGKHVIRAGEMSNPLKVELNSHADKIEIWGNATINGNVRGDVKAGGGVNCDKIEGNVTAGAGVNCDEVNGNINAGASINCDAVNGNATAGANIVCDDIGGNVNCSSTLQCDNISGDVSCGMTITCDSITGNVKTCNGDIHVKLLKGKIENCERSVYIKEEN